MSLISSLTIESISFSVLFLITFILSVSPSHSLCHFSLLSFSPPSFLHPENLSSLLSFCLYLRIIPPLSSLLSPLLSISSLSFPQPNFSLSLYLSSTLFTWSVNNTHMPSLHWSLLQSLLSRFHDRAAVISQSAHTHSLPHTQTGCQSGRVCDTQRVVFLSVRATEWNCG